MFEHINENCNCIFCRLVNEYKLDVKNYENDKEYFKDYDSDYNTEEYGIQYDNVKIEEKYRHYIKFSGIVDSISIPFIETLDSINKAMIDISYANSNFKLNYIFGKIKEAYLYSFSNFEIGVKERIEIEQKKWKRINVSEEKIKNKLYDKNRINEVVTLGRELNQQFRIERNNMVHQLINQVGRAINKVPLNLYIVYLESIFKIKTCVEVSIEIYDMTENVDELDDVVYRNIRIKKVNYFKVINKLIDSILTRLEDRMELLLSRDCRATVNSLFECKEVIKKLEQRKNCYINHREWYYKDSKKREYSEEDIEYRNFVIELANNCKEKNGIDIQKKYCLTIEEKNYICNEEEMKEKNLLYIEIDIDKLYKIYKKKQFLKQEKAKIKLMDFSGDDKLVEFMIASKMSPKISNIDSSGFWFKFRENIIMPIMSSLFEKDRKFNKTLTDEEIQLINVFRKSYEDDYIQVPMLTSVIESTENENNQNE